MAANGVATSRDYLQKAASESDRATLASEADTAEHHVMVAAAQVSQRRCP
jgi:hypothetical protein